MVAENVLCESLQFSTSEVPYYFGVGLETFSAEYLSSIQPSRILVVVDANVHERFAKCYKPLWQDVAPVEEFVFPPGEEAKTPEQLGALLSWAVHARADRRAVVVGLGGGVVGNIAGLLSHLLLRGVRFVHMPTTHISAFDSVLSLKQAINVGGVKNFAGAFHLPSSILCDASMFSTMGEREIRAGLAESIKNALIAVPGHVDGLMTLSPDVTSYGLQEHVLLWRTGIEAKRPYLAKDPHEKRSALIFEYGHTAGHAIEAASLGRIRHGEAVATGLIIAARVAEELGYLRRDAVALHEELVTRFGLPRTIDSRLNATDIEKFLMRDNKKGYLSLTDDRLAMVLISDLGKPILTGDLPLTPVPRATLMQVMSSAIC